MSIHGGNLQDIPAGTPRFSASNKRKIKATFSTWVGTSAIGAKHYYLEIKIEDDYFVNCTCKPNEEQHDHHLWGGQLPREMRGTEERFEFVNHHAIVNAFHGMQRLFEMLGYTVEEPWQLEEWEDIGWAEYERERNWSEEKVAREEERRNRDGD